MTQQVSITDTVHAVHHPANSDTAVLYLPGMSGGAFTDTFQPVFNAITERGWGLLRVQSWESTDELLEKTLDEFHTEINTALQHLREEGYDTVGVVAKSFSAGCILTHTNLSVAARILWAPAIGVSTESTVEEWRSKPFAEMEDLETLAVDESFLQQQIISTRLVHGTEDEVIPVENSEKIASMLPDADLVTIPDTGHSYESEEAKTRLKDATVQFFDQHLL